MLLVAVDTYYFVAISVKESFGWPESSSKTCEWAFLTPLLVGARAAAISFRSSVCLFTMVWYFLLLLVNMLGRVINFPARLMRVLGFLSVLSYSWFSMTSYTIILQASSSLHMYKRFLSE